MSPRISRRIALKVLGAGMALPLGVLALRSVRDAPAPVRWNGTALGALASMTLWHPNPAVARHAITRMRIEVGRLEDIFSLHRPSSELVRLNRSGRLDAPSRDLLNVFDHSLRMADLSNGAFDPTIQPLWQFHAAGGLTVRGFSGLRAVLARIDHTAVELRANSMRFGRPGMAASLNGIAQGYITDRVTEILGNEGFENAVIELGETRALGAAPDGDPFSIDLVSPASPTALDREVPLANAALAVSGGYGTPFHGTGSHHIFDPATGKSPRELVQVAVISPKATAADALSTAIYVAGEQAARGLLSSYPSSRAILFRSDGTSAEL